MSSMKKPRTWICIAAFASAFWITLRVMAATPPPPPPLRESVESMETEVASRVDEVRDPVLEKMIAHFASATGASGR